MTNRKVLGALFLMIAIVSIIFAVVCFQMLDDRHADYERYGGDAYTGIQNATAATAKYIAKIGGFGFIIVGLTFASIGTAFLIPPQKEKEAFNNAANDTEEQENHEEVEKEAFNNAANDMEEQENHEEVEKEELYSCPKCNEAVPFGTERCPKCGTAFDWNKRKLFFANLSIHK